ncbi:hypothetical protein [Streptomyces sp. NPDC053427]|uniref:hypothetical protein n=1 Tax=Streptomyces sp. NPDC053427 TaxID=3365701 RepID=UPI0037D3E78B
MACGTCGNQVLCEKFSPAHTQVQWTTDAAGTCPRIRARVAAGELSARVRSCDALRESIARAVENGTLVVADKDGNVDGDAHGDGDGNADANVDRKVDGNAAVADTCEASAVTDG